MTACNASSHIRGEKDPLLGTQSPAWHPEVLMPQSPFFLEGSGPGSGLQLPRKEGQEGAELGLLSGLLQEPGQALPQPLPPEIWVPTAKGLMSTLSPSPVWLSASHCLPSVLLCSLVPQECCRGCRHHSPPALPPEGFGSGHVPPWHRQKRQLGTLDTTS